MIVVTHEMGFARKAGDRVVFMDSGSIVEEADPDEFFTNPRTDRAKDFLTRAGTIIFAMSVVVWFLQSFSPDFKMVADSAQSIFGRIGAAIAPIFRPLGFGEWEKSVALLSGTIAKEAVVSTMQVLYSAETTQRLGEVLATKFTPLSAYAFLVFTLLYVPCVSAIAAIRREIGSWRLTLLSIGLQTGTAYIVALIVYQVGRLFAG